MGNESSMQRLCDGYIRRVGVIGALYCAVPTVLWFAGLFILEPFRGVYVLRLVLSLALGCSLAAFANRFALTLWVIKHRSSAGPATVADGVLLGAATGWATALLPPLTALIATNHLELAKAFIIVAWLVAAAVGAVIGGVLATVGSRHLDRAQPAHAE